MTLPLDLVLIRHGQSEGNAAKRLSETGDDTGLAALKGRHTRSFRLSQQGREQAVEAGTWLRREFYDTGHGFDRYFTSEYTRAMETAALLGLPDATWYRNFYLTERDWGDLEMLTDAERQARFGDVLRMRTIEPFFWRPPNGESFAELCLRLDRVLQTLHREHSNMRVVIVCHGEVMRGFRVLIERMSQQNFKEQNLSREVQHRVHNCEIMHYTRRDPGTGEVASHANWMRRVRPAEAPIWDTGWEKIERPRYTNEDLLKVVESTEFQPRA